MSAKTVRMLILAFVALGLFVWVMTNYINPNSEAALSKITEPQYNMVCGKETLYYGKTMLRTFNTTLSGFRVYFMDGTSAWLSSGNNCTIRNEK